MGYTRTSSDPRTQRHDPVNRRFATGEFQHFLETVVGASLYGDMPASLEAFLAGHIVKDRGYSDDWPALNTDSAEDFQTSQRTRQNLMKELTRRGEHLDEHGTIAGALLFPPEAQALEGARGYRTGKMAFKHQDGRAYSLGEVITDREIDTDPRSLTYGVGITPTLIGVDKEIPILDNYEPLLDFPSH